MQQAAFSAIQQLLVQHQASRHALRPPHYVNSCALRLIRLNRLQRSRQSDLALPMLTQVPPASQNQDRDWRTVALSGMRPSLSWIAEIDFLFTTEPHGKSLSGDSHLLIPERRGTSELKLSATIFHLPSDCLTHTAISFPRSSIGAPFGALIVIWYL
jgi:hypothetical protein